MIVKELINNKDFDINANISLYDRAKGTWHESKPVWRTLDAHHKDVPAEILTKKIVYITVDTDTTCLIVEFDEE